MYSFYNSVIPYIYRNILIRHHRKELHMLINDSINTIQLPLKKDLMFSLIMNDQALCKSLLERILPAKKIRTLQVCEGSNMEIQKTLFTGIISKTVRLDVLFEGDDSWYDVEMMDSSNLFMPG